MNKYFNKISMCLCMGALVLSAASCSEPDDIITSVQYDRLFSPTEIGARVKNRTSVEVSWSTRNAKVDLFTVEVSADEAFSSIAKTATATTSPVTIAGLEGETDYFVRVKASAEGETESKWSPSAKFTTDTENIYLPMEDGDLQATTVTLRWTPGETVESIEVLDQAGALVKSQKVSAEECAAGVATVTDLQGETTYTFQLKRNGKTRGSINLTTELDLAGAIKVTTDDDFATMLKDAEEGDVFAFMPGEYAPVTDEGTAITSITLSKSISIKAAKSSDKPVLKGFNIKVNNGVSLDLLNVVLDGKNSEDKDHTDQAIIAAEAGTIDHITVSGCEIKNFAKGVLYVNYATAITKVDFNHNFIHDIACSGGDGFDMRNGAAAEFVFTNNSVVNVASVGKRDLFRMDANGNKVVAEGTITITNNNFENVSNDASKRILYIRLGDTFPITFSNNVISNTKAYYTNQKTTKIAEVSNNNYFNAPNFVACEVANAQVDASGTSKALDPKYDANYLVTDEDLIYAGIGNF